MTKHSLTRHLLAWALGALALVWASFIAVGFRTGIHEADELTDGHLASVASILLSERNGDFTERRDVGSKVGPELKRHDYQQSMSIVVWNGAGQPVTRSGDAPSPAFDASEGFSDLQIGEPPTRWRAFSQWDGPGHARKVMVMLRERERDELAWDIAGQVIEPGLWLLPVVALALGLAIRRGLSPLYELSQDVHALDVNQPTPLRLRHPQVEFEAVVESINQLVQRHQAALGRERQLASEMAHEMRTPLTALALQARALRGALTDAERAESLQRIELDAMRAGQVLTQLLALARASHTEMAEAAQPLDLAALAGRVVADYAERAGHSGHELALVAPASFALTGHPVLLEMALRNLLDNALGHTPSGTLVEVQLDASARSMQVCDNGAFVCQTPGSAPNPESPPTTPVPVRKALTLGLGLGHRVVEKIATIHHAGFGASPPPAGFSTCYRVTFHGTPGHAENAAPAAAGADVSGAARPVG
jgi:two-component system, OmpR family, sensor histidine kinase QseC